MSIPSIRTCENRWKNFGKFSLKYTLGLCAILEGILSFIILVYKCILVY